MIRFNPKFLSSKVRAENVRAGLRRYPLTGLMRKQKWQRFDAVAAAVAVGLPWPEVLPDCSPKEIGDRTQTCKHI